MAQRGAHSQRIQPAGRGHAFHLSLWHGMKLDSLGLEAAELGRNCFIFSSTNIRLEGCRCERRRLKTFWAAGQTAGNCWSCGGRREQSLGRHIQRSRYGRVRRWPFPTLLACSHSNAARCRAIGLLLQMVRSEEYCSRWQGQHVHYLPLQHRQEQGGRGAAGWGAERVSWWVGTRR